MASKLAALIATWFGCGYFPVAPGTVGSLAAVLIGAALARAGWESRHIGLLAVLCAAPAVWASGAYARLRKMKDPSTVVVDEVVGQWVTLTGAMALNWKSLIAAFLLFRLFDIWKPAPLRRLEKLPAGYGIVADDLMAGVYGAVVLFLLGWFNLY